MSAYVRWEYRGQNYLELDCFRSGTMQVQKFPVYAKFLHIRYLEASWPADTTFHRLEPLTGSIRTCAKKRLNGDSIQQWADDQSYAYMLHNSMNLFQDFIVLSNNGPEQRNRGAEESFALLNRPSKHVDDKWICIWVQECS